MESLGAMGRGASSKALAEFTRSFAVLVGAHIPLVRALEATRKQATGRTLRSVLRDVQERVEAGQSLSAALAEHPATFRPLYVHLVEVGETAGGLGAVLSRLADYLERAHAVRRKVRLAMVYPGVILAVATGVVTFMLTTIVPTFAEMFEGFGAELPAATQYVMQASRLLTTYWPLALLLLLAPFVTARMALRAPSVRWWWDGARLRLPLVGPVQRKSLAARFGRTLGTLLGRGVPLTEALRLLAGASENVRARAQLEAMREAVERGGALADELRAATAFPPLMSQMILVGEETARLDEMLLHVAALYEEELDATVDTLTSVLEPILIVIIGVLLGGILIALYLPMFDLVTAVQ